MAENVRNMLSDAITNFFNFYANIKLLVVLILSVCVNNNRYSFLRRIVVGLFYVAAARRVLCDIYKQKMYGKSYVWLFIGKQG